MVKYILDEKEVKEYEEYLKQQEKEIKQLPFGFGFLLGFLFGFIGTLIILYQLGVY